MIRQCKRLRVANPNQCQAVCGRSNATLLAITTFKHLPYPVRLLLPHTDGHQGPGDVANHVLKKRIRTDIERNPVLITMNIQRMYRAPR